MGVIIRTAGQDVKKTDISRDYRALLKLWNQITTTTIKSTAPKLIHEEGNLLKTKPPSVFSAVDNTFPSASTITKLAISA